MRWLTGLKLLTYKSVNLSSNPQTHTKQDAAVQVSVTLAHLQGGKRQRQRSLQKLLGQPAWLTNGPCLKQRGKAVANNRMLLAFDFHIHST